MVKWPAYVPGSKARQVPGFADMSAVVRPGEPPVTGVAELGAQSASGTPHAALELVDPPPPHAIAGPSRNRPAHSARPNPSFIRGNLPRSTARQSHCGVYVYSRLETASVECTRRIASAAVNGTSLPCANRTTSTWFSSPAGPSTAPPTTIDASASTK